MGLVPDPDIVFNTNSSQEEVTAFLSGPVIGRKSSPFTWWKDNQTKFANLAWLARRFLSAPMASIASEGEFKVAKRVVNDRYSLKPDNVTNFYCSNITCEWLIMIFNWYHLTQLLSRSLKYVTGYIRSKICFSEFQGFTNTSLQFIDFKNWFKDIHEVKMT